MSTTVSSTNKTIQVTVRCLAHVATLVVAWITLTLMYVLFEAKPSLLDSLVFKQAGVNFLSQGMSSVNYLDYPEVALPSNPLLTPVYPILFGLFTGIVGVGLKQAILFDHILKATRTLFLLLFLWPWLKPRLNFGDLRGRFALFFLLPLSVLPYHSGHPVDLAIIFGLWSWYLLRDQPKEDFNWVLSGVLGGLAFGTSLVGGVFFAMGASLFAMGNGEGRRKAMFWWGSALAVVTVCILPVVVHSTTDSRSLPSLILGTFLYDNVDWRLNQGGGIVSIFSLWVLVILNLYLWWTHKEKKRTPFIPFLLTAFAFIPILLCCWPPPLKYLWIPRFVLFGSAIGLWIENERHDPKYLVGALLWLAIFPGLYKEVEELFHGLEQPIHQTSGAIRDKVLSYVEFDKKLAVSANSYFAFRAVRPVAVIALACPKIEKFHYVYQEGIANDVASPQISCKKKAECFTVLADFREKHPITVLGITVDQTIPSRSGVLFSNTRCLSSPNYALQDVAK